MVTIDTIIERLKSRNISEEKLEEVRKSYNLAKEIHKGQYRQSGEEYIIHPLNVAKNLLDIEVYDTDTICAALLHDTIEDAPFDFTKEDVKKLSYTYASWLKAALLTYYFGGENVEEAEMIRYELAKRGEIVPKGRILTKEKYLQLKKRNKA